MIATHYRLTATIRCYADLTIPTFHNLEPLLDRSTLPPWSERRPVLFWRGSSTGAYYYPNTTFEKFHR